MFQDAGVCVMCVLVACASAGVPQLLSCNVQQSRAALHAQTRTGTGSTNTWQLVVSLCGSSRSMGRLNKSVVSLDNHASCDDMAHKQRRDVTEAFEVLEVLLRPHRPARRGTGRSPYHQRS
jgi:hypothetical protein